MKNTEIIEQDEESVEQKFLSNSTFGLSRMESDQIIEKLVNEAVDRAEGPATGRVVVSEEEKTDFHEVETEKDNFNIVKREQPLILLEEVSSQQAYKITQLNFKLSDNPVSHLIGKVISSISENDFDKMTVGSELCLQKNLKKVVKEMIKEGGEYGLDEVVQRVEELSKRFLTNSIACGSPKMSTARASQVSPKVVAKIRVKKTKVDSIEIET